MLMAINLDGWGPGDANDHTGPTDDGMISTAVGAQPSDPYCCQGPAPAPGGEHCVVLLTLFIYFNTFLLAFNLSCVVLFRDTGHACLSFFFGLDPALLS